MKSPSLDKFYTHIDRCILLAQAYTEIKNLFFIIKACRLKPFDYVFGREDKFVLFRRWFDEFGNSLDISTNKRIKITYNDLSLDRSKIISTDLYYGLSLERIAKISKLSYIFLGKDEDTYQDCILLAFLGIDNYLRVFVLEDDDWRQVSPLILGMTNLKFIGGNRDIHYFREHSIKENAPIPCLAPEAWLTFMPANRVFMALMERRCPLISPLFNNTKEQ